MPFGKKSIFAEMAEAGKKEKPKESKKEPKKEPKSESKATPEGVKEITIRVVDNGGFIVSYNKPHKMEKDQPMSMEHGRVEKTYDSLEGVGKCMTEVFGKAEA